MRFEKGHKAATRRHIVDVASKCFRRDGVSAAGIAGIMGEAGLTKGAFFPHFESKEALRPSPRPYLGGCSSPVNQPTASDSIGSDAIAICST
jgi:TetR/AcrR family transcriptional repressor of nem operon